MMRLLRQVIATSILSIPLTDCGHDPRKGAIIEPPFISYVQEFEKQCNCKVRDLPITFQTLDEEDHAGECWNYVWFTESYSEVAIDREWWDNSLSDAHEQLIFHELGHCVLHRDHLSTRSGRYPISLMYPSMGEFGIFHYPLNRQKYFDELFLRFLPTSPESP